MLATQVIAGHRQLKLTTIKSPAVAVVVTMAQRQQVKIVHMPVPLTPAMPATIPATGNR